MGKPDKLLFSALLRRLRQFKLEDIPVTGIVGSSLVFHTFNPQQEVRQLLCSPPPNTTLADGFNLVDMLKIQLETLKSAPPIARNCLHEWNQLLSKIADAPGSAFVPALAAETALQLLEVQADLILDSDGDPVAAALLEKSCSNAEDMPTKPPLDMNSLAMALAPRLAEGGDTYSHLSMLSHLLYKQEKLKYQPFEWVYEGLRPLMLSDVLKRRKGCPITLATVAAAVGRRAGLPLIPIPTTSSSSSSSSSSSFGSKIDSSNQAKYLQELPPELVMKLSGGGQGGAPPLGNWLLASPPSLKKDYNQSNEWLLAPPEVFLDASTGEVYGKQEVVDKYPGVFTGHSPSQVYVECILRLWQDLVRTLVQAHQRRGESDIVAQWYYVLLALDTQASEWDHVLAGPEVAVT